MKKLDKTLFVGIGNNTRQDDGLGWCFIDKLEQLGIKEDLLEKKYQLMVEEADLIADFETVYFIDASKRDLPNGFEVAKVVAAKEVNFTTHSVPPNQVLFLCESVYNKFPTCYVVEIQGFNWEIGIGLSLKAQENLNTAFAFITSNI